MRFDHIAEERQENHFTIAHLEESAIRGTLIASLLGNLQCNQKLARANAHIEAELRRMARIQRALLPRPIPDIPGKMTLRPSFSQRHNLDNLLAAVAAARALGVTPGGRLEVRFSALRGERIAADWLS